MNEKILPDHQTVDQVLRFYDTNAQSYFDRTHDKFPSEVVSRFVNHLPQSAYVIDAGCGSGRDTIWFLENGYRVYSYDGSKTLTNLAAANVGRSHPIHHQCHHELALDVKADGALAMASLLFANDDDLKAAMMTLASNLKPGGVLCTSFKAGQGWHPVGGNLQRFLAIEDRQWLGGLAGLQTLEAWVSGDKLGRDNQWSNFIFRKP